MKKKKDNRGGFRANAKRPLKYGEATTTVNFRVPESQKAAVRKIVNDFLENLIKS